MPRFTVKQALIGTAFVATGFGLLTLPPSNFREMSELDLGYWFYLTLPIHLVAGALMGVAITLPARKTWRWIGAIAGALAIYFIRLSFRI
jgi:hypothetical protein